MTGDVLFTGMINKECNYLQACFVGAEYFCRNVLEGFFFYLQAWLTGDIISCALDLDQGLVEFFRFVTHEVIVYWSQCVLNKKEHGS